MAAIIAANWLAILFALLIGIAVAYWIWGHRPHEDWVMVEDQDEALPFSPPYRDANDPTHNIAEVGIEATPATSTPPPPPLRIAPALGAPDNLMALKGIGPKLNLMLGDLGVSRFDQIAAWTPADIAEVDQHLGAFSGRIERDNWVDQAQLLTEGRLDLFMQRYGNLDMDAGLD